MNYYEHHLGDWAAATSHLTWDEDMAYTRLLRAYYHAERAIPEGQQYRLAKAGTPAQRKAVDSVLAEFFTLSDGSYRQKRADAEIARYQAKEPEREAKRENDAERKRRSRERRKALFDELRGHGVVPAYDAPTDLLVTLLSRVTGRGHVADTTATQHQTPDTNKEHSSLRSEARKRAPEDVTVPDWVPAVSWKAFVQHRKDIRKPLTAKAAELAIAELENLKAQGHEPAAVINQSIVSRWAGLFPLKGVSHVKPAGTGNAGRSLSAPERVAAAIAERDAAGGRTLEHGAAG